MFCVIVRVYQLVQAINILFSARGAPKLYQIIGISLISQSTVLFTPLSFYLVLLSLAANSFPIHAFHLILSYPLPTSP